MADHLEEVARIGACFHRAFLELVFVLEPLEPPEQPEPPEPPEGVLRPGDAAGFAREAVRALPEGIALPGSGGQ
ncbi:hypothetical protein [Streptomyces sp. NPDC088554]|uniref:hypothetical protein n=1 Tax=Streptomyces sp. NPDC088554 TaxID=3365865 RepID=UPI0037F17723